MGLSSSWVVVPVIMTFIPVILGAIGEELTSDQVLSYRLVVLVVV